MVKTLVREGVVNTKVVVLVSVRNQIHHTKSAKFR